MGFSENQAIKFEVYPNPSNGIFNLSMSHHPENLQIIITDIRGSIIKEIEPGKQTGQAIYQINLSGTPRGVYFLKLYNEGFVGIKKVVLN